MRAVCLTLLGLATVVVGCRPPAAAEPASSSAPVGYVLRLGNDTLAVDQYTLSRDRVEGTLVTHLPRTVVTRYSVTLDPATYMATQAQYGSRLPDGSLIRAGSQPPVQQVTISFSGDSATARIQRDTVSVVRVAAPRALPYINYSVAFFQLPILAARAAGLDTAAYAIYTGGRLTTPLGVRRSAPNAYTVSIGGYRYAVTTDNAGMIQTVDGALTTQHFIARRHGGGQLDVNALAAAWAAQSRANAAPALSLRDTTRATIGVAQLWVDYGRPLARGRRVWGPNGVLNDTIWRTGANAATQFRTNVPLTIGGRLVPAGTYTLWTLAIPGRYQLIINKQVGQWGTVYDPAQDLVRVPLQSRTLSPPVEEFTIAIDPSGANAGVLRLRWANLELSVPYTAP
jgi:hypothetical protein